MKLLWMPKRIFTRFLLIIAVPAFLIQAISTFMFYHRHWNDVSNSMAQTVIAEIILLDHLLTLYPSEHENIITQFKGRLFSEISVKEKSLMPPQPGNKTALPIVYNMFAKRLTSSLGKNVEVSLTPTHMVHVRLWLAHGELDILFSHKRFDPPTTYIFLLWMLGTAVVVVAVAILFMRTQVRSIITLAEMAEQFGKGQKLNAFKPSGAIEVRRAGMAFIKIMQRLERQILQRTELLAGVSHDLRTPLTRITLQLAMIPPCEEVELMRHDVQVMERMIQEYLDFAKGEGHEVRQEVDLVQLLRQSIEPYLNKVELQVIFPASCKMMLRPITIKRAMQNLLDNATSYGSKVEVRVKELSSLVEIAVADNGPGIPEDKREAVFRPFFRLNAARTVSEDGGVGLGLAIAKDIISGHGGTIEIQRHPVLGGAQFVIRLPK